MIKEGIVLCYKVSESGIEVDKAEMRSHIAIYHSPPIRGKAYSKALLGLIALLRPTTNNSTGGKLKSRWYGPFTVSKDMKNVAIKLYDEDGNEFIVNKKHVKPYQKEELDFDGNDDVTLEDEGGVT
ncbi:hypothetical protein Tco_0916739 [Tanacetum coccineum]